MNPHHSLVRICALLVVTCLLHLAAVAQYIQEGAKLHANEGALVSRQGVAVGISSDGNTAIVGGKEENNAAGVAWIYTRSNGTWTQQGGKLVGTGAAGSSNPATVAISGDGNTVIIGGYADNGGTGAVWIFTRSNGTWSQVGSKLVGTGAIGAAVQGYSVALSYDGTTAIVGGYADNNYIGAVWVYTLNDGAWSQQGNKLTGTGASASANFGSTVALSSDGNTAIVGGPNDNSSKGAVWAFIRTNGSWTQQGSKLIGSNGLQSPQQGSAISISADGNTALIGGYHDRFGYGAAWVFVRTAGVWSQQGGKLASADDDPNANRGHAVSISADGNIALVGAPGASSGVGGTAVYVRTDGVWAQEGSLLTGNDVVGAAAQGGAVALSADGSTAIVGGLVDNGLAGASWIYALHGEGYTYGVQDVPNDQGGKVRLTWGRSFLDAAGAFPRIVSYHIWRRIPVQLARARKLKSPLGIPQDTITSLYDYVTSVPAMSASPYNVVVPTLVDSSGTIDFNQTFLVTAHAANANRYWVSSSISGYSVDNLAPLPPGNVGATIQGGLVTVQWQPTGDVDLSHYEVYASTVSGFTPDISNLLGTSAQTSYQNSAPDPGVIQYFRVRGVDVHGNAGAYSQEAGIGVPIEHIYSVNTGWNLISLPFQVSDNSKTVLFPASISNAYNYTDTYQAASVLSHGIGYWLKFPAVLTMPVEGLFRTADTITLHPGWNIIGSLTTAIGVGDIASSDAGMTLSPLYAYTNTYVVADSVRPGLGYWVKANKAGDIYLTAPGAKTLQTHRVTFAASADRPPAPPSELFQDGESVPKEYGLKQNYPNPFNPSTVIHYQLPVESRVRLIVSNILGQEVRTLADEIQSTGEKAVTFDAASLPTGMYFYRLDATSVSDPANHFSQTMRMLLVK